MAASERACNTPLLHLHPMAATDRMLLDMAVKQSPAQMAANSQPAAGWLAADDEKREARLHSRRRR